MWLMLTVIEGFTSSLLESDVLLFVSDVLSPNDIVYRITSGVIFATNQSAIRLQNLNVL